MKNDMYPSMSVDAIDAKEMNLIAGQMIEWRRKQNEAFAQAPLKYIQYLLDQMSEAEYVAWEDIPDEVCKLVPGLKLADCIALVGIYLDRPSASG